MPPAFGAEISSSWVSGFLREASRLAQPKKLKGAFYAQKVGDPFWVLPLYDTRLPRIAVLHPRGAFVIDNWIPQSASAGLVNSQAVRVLMADGSAMYFMIVYEIKYPSMIADVKSINVMGAPNGSDVSTTALIAPVKDEELGGMICSRLYDIAEDFQSKAEDKALAQELAQGLQPCKMLSGAGGTLLGLKKMQKAYRLSSGVTENLIVFESADKRRRVFVKFPPDPSSSGQVQEGIKYHVVLSIENYFIELEVSDLRHLFNFSSAKDNPRLALMCGFQMYAFSAVGDDTYRGELLKTIEGDNVDRRHLVPIEYLKFTEEKLPTFTYRNSLTGEIIFVFSDYGPDYFRRKDLTMLDKNHVTILKGDSNGTELQQLYAQAVSRSEEGEHSVFKADLGGQIALTFTAAGAMWERNGEKVAALEATPLEKSNVINLLNKPLPVARRVCEHLEKGRASFY